MILQSLRKYSPENTKGILIYIVEVMSKLKFLHKECSLKVQRKA